MNISTKFNIKDNVYIVELERKGKILAIHINEEGISYKVRYFDNASAKEVYFFADELECKKNGS